MAIRAGKSCFLLPFWISRPELIWDLGPANFCVYKHECSTRTTCLEATVAAESPEDWHSNLYVEFQYRHLFSSLCSALSIRRRFPESQVEIVNCHSRTKLDRVGYHRLNMRLRHLVPSYLIRHLRRQNSYRRCQDCHLEIDLTQGLISDSYEESMEYLAAQSYDVILVGSDTVLNFYDWNFERNEPPIYWLPPKLNGAKAMLAASIGTELRLDQIELPMRRRLAASAGGFSVLGVRDVMTRDFLVALNPDLECRIIMVPDPTFSYEVEISHAEKYLIRKGIDAAVPLIGLDLPLTLPGMEEAIRSAKSDGYGIVTWRGNCKLADYDFSDMSPLEWSGMFSRYGVTLTNRFHASVFSLKNGRPVIAVDVKPKRIGTGQRSKISELLGEFGMAETHYRNRLTLSDPTYFKTIINSSLRKAPSGQIEAGLELQRRDYDSYLNHLHGLFAGIPVPFGKS